MYTTYRTMQASFRSARSADSMVDTIWRWIFSLTLILFLLIPLSIHAQEFWVSPYGNDLNPGTKHAPFQTLAKARDATRELDLDLEVDIFVNLFGGVHRLTEPLVLDERDSGRGKKNVIWRAEPGEKPIISGSMKIEKWEQLPDHDSIYMAQIDPGIRSRQLFVNGKRATRAATNGYPATRYPTSFLPDHRQGILYEVTNYNDPAWADPALWDNPGEIDAVLITQWKMMIIGVESVHPPADGSKVGRLAMKNPAWTNANSFYQRLDWSNPDAYGPGWWSFWQVTRFENSLSFLNLPGEWALDSTVGRLYYKPLPGEDMAEANVEMPVIEALVTGIGSPENPVTNIRFEDLTFRYATWLKPSGDEGYVVDQSGVYLVDKNPSNLIGHIQPNTLHCPERLGRTPGNVRFRHARNITFKNNVFERLGAVALDFDTGSQENLVWNNRFTDISSSAIQVGGVAEIDHHPPTSVYRTSDNTIFNNLIQETGQDYLDSAAIFIGSTTRTTIRNNTITDVPWSGIALGWGWGLIDPGSFPGLPNAYPGMWGFYNTPTATRENNIVYNRIERFLQTLWDGGAIYTTGAQGESMATGTILLGNIALDKRPDAGGNIFYTDGGSRYVMLVNNVSFNNPPGYFYFGPPPIMEAPLPYSDFPSSLNGEHYGQDTGGCRTHGDIFYLLNFWQNDTYFNICPYKDLNETVYPHNLLYFRNQIITSLEEVPAYIFENAGFKGVAP